MSNPTPHPYHEVLIIGGGQAGLSLSYLLKQRGVSHLILEKHQLGHAWRSERWDSFCLVTPNWQCTLPGFPYQGNDPDGFMVKQQIVDYIDGYIAAFAPPAREGVTVTAVRAVAPRDGGGYEVATDAGVFRAGQVVLAVGGYHTPILPADAAELPANVAQLHSSDYLNPAQLPDGEVLVVGTGQSGCQIAEDLHLAGRKVHLCVGDAPRVARSYRGKDVVKWLDEMAYYDLPVERHPLGAGVREKTNHYVTGRDGGRDIDLRKFALEGMALYGRYEGLRDGVAHFGGDLRANLDGADAVYRKINDSIDRHIEQHGIAAPAQAPYEPLWQPANDAPASLDMAGGRIAAVVWCIGFRTDFGWIDADIFDQRGYPRHERGVTEAAGLYFLGLPWQYTWGSGRFSGIGRDAEHLSAHIVAHAAAGAGQQPALRQA
ncbi:MSMEG_0569 family flavin-dependent oxidoreductase [Janthinobacterium sp. PC23-8]|uniref:MSMEG_0569 family flavin-dependent oxidoreductase n=1 Tax=Janthinobacterium sp. PC23-8 TaxID=2012679 RepID=UPI000B9784CD|nr:MSMEG_0569 family flavin-dependent oxidoreductase [Janthinobacterium sp. PC23-8]OYO27592.1 FAD-dependent oxidoreductase [Janthinobacterium sp. PC23-8]